MYLADWKVEIRGPAQFSGNRASPLLPVNCPPIRKLSIQMHQGILQSLSLLMLRVGLCVHGDMQQMCSTILHWTIPQFVALAIHSSFAMLRFACTLGSTRRRSYRIDADLTSMSTRPLGEAWCSWSLPSSSSPSNDRYLISRRAPDEKKEVVSEEEQPRSDRYEAEHKLSGPQVLVKSWIPL